MRAKFVKPGLIGIYPMNWCISEFKPSQHILIYIVHFLQLSHIIKTSQTFPVSHNHACNATAYSRNLFQLGSVRFIQID